MLRIGLTEFDDKRWPSVSSTYEFYRSALASAFEVSVVAPADLAATSENLDAVVNFKGSQAWLERERIACPVLFGMHGGLIVDHDFVLRNLSRLRTCDTLLVNCTSDKEIVRSWFSGRGPRLALLPLPSETTASGLRTRNECRRALNIEANDAVLGFVARLLPAKNLHGFLRMMMLVRNHLRPQRILGLVVGTYWLDYPLLGYCAARYPDYIKKMISRLGIEEDLVYFPASLKREELQLIYSAMDVLVHPTYGIDENFGYVPVEAMAAGVPVVGAAYGGLKDTVKNGETGYLMGTWTTSGGIRMDMHGGVARIIDLLTTPDRRLAMARAARRHIMDHYNERVCTNALVAAVNDAVAASCESGPVRLTRRPPVEPTYPRASLLPEIDRGWFKFDHVVAHYVSGPVPELQVGDQISAAGPIAMEGGLARLDDPAWPVAEQLQSGTAELLETLPFESTLAATADWPDRKATKVLLQKGWLLVHRPPKEMP